MTLTDIIALLSTQHWLPLVLLLTVYARKLCSPDSGFPLSISPRWLPTVTASGGLIYGFVSQLPSGQGKALLAAVVTAGVGGFGDGLLTAIFAHETAPKWARALVWIFDDVTKAPPAAKGPPTKMMFPEDK